MYVSEWAHENDRGGSTSGVNEPQRTRRSDVETGMKLRKLFSTQAVELLEE